MRKTLIETFKEHTGKVSDKWTLYLNEWDRLFEPFRNQPISLFEIGIQNGGSLEIWAKYFLEAKKIVGCDVDEKCRQLKFDDDRIAVAVCDANSDDCEKEILRQTQSFDIIIDDGSHKSSDIVRSFARYFPHLNDSGIYVVEDLHTSYWADYEGGLYNPLSAISFFKRLADIVNYEHWRNNQSRSGMLTAFTKNFGIKFEELDLKRIHSIEFINSLCIIKKLPYNKNNLDKRITVGVDDSISGEGTKSNGTLIQEIGVTIKDDANLDVFELIELTKSLAFTIREREQTIQALTTQVNERCLDVQTLRTQVNESDLTKQTLTAQSEKLEMDMQALNAQILRDNQTITNITTQVDKQEKENWNLKSMLAQSQEEVLFYANSKSWKITRPLRMITKLIRKKLHL